MRPMIRFGKKITIEPTTAIKHQLKGLMAVADSNDNAKPVRAKEGSAPLPAKQ